MDLLKVLGSRLTVVVTHKSVNCFVGSPHALRGSRICLEEGHFQKRAFFWELETESSLTRSYPLGKMISTHA